MLVRPISVLIPGESAKVDIDGHVLQAKTAFATMRKQGAYETLPAQMLVYRITTPQRSYSGIVLGVDAKAFKTSTIVHHERTIPKKEAQQIEVAIEQGGFSKPILLTHRPIPIIRGIMDRLSQQQPLLEVYLEKYNATHRVWPITSPKDIDIIVDAYATKSNGYIVDGHHRTAALNILHEDPEFNLDSGLCAMFDIEQLDILPFHRIVNSPMPIEELASRLGEIAQVEHLNAPRFPTRTGEIILMDTKQAWSIKWKDTPKDKVHQLDVHLFTQRILSNTLNISEADQNKKVSYLEGKYDVSEIQNAIRQSGTMAFLLHPITVEDLIEITTAGQRLPPKSTWFLPRMANGIISINF